MLKDTRGRYEYGVLRNQFYIGLQWSRSENAYAERGNPRRVFDARKDPPGVPPRPNSNTLRARLCLCLSPVSKSINNLYHLVHSMGEPICTCVALQGTCTHSTFSFASSGPARISCYPLYIGCTDKLTDLTLMDRPWSDVSSTEIGHVGANEISRDDMNVIHIFCIFSRKSLFYLFIHDSLSKEREENQ